MIVKLIETFDDIINQDLPKTCLKAIINKPYDSPKHIVLSGPYGIGRNSLARLFAENINRERHVPNNYIKLDYSMVESNMETIRNIVSNKEEYYVIVIEEADKLSRQTQIDLLELHIECAFIIYIVNEATDLIEQLYSRSFVLRCSPLSIEEITDKLLEIKQINNLDVDDKEINVIARRAEGHLTNAINCLNKYTIVSKEAFNITNTSARELYIALLISCYSNKVEDVKKYIGKLKAIPLSYLKKDYESLILEIMKTYTKVQEPKDEMIKILIRSINNKALDLYYILNEKVIYDSFVNDDRFQAAMYVIYLKITNQLR